MGRLVCGRWIVGLAVIALAGRAYASLIGTGQEIQIGKQVSGELEKRYGVSHDAAMNRRIAAIGRRVARVSERQNVRYVYRVLSTREVNAVACPGGFIYAFRGLVNRFPENDELAAVLAHETAHVAKRHSVEELERAMGFQFLLQLLTGGEGSKWGSMALDLIMRGYSRSQEAEADEYGQIYAFKAGYGADAMTRALVNLHRATGGGGGVPEWLSTHPSDKSRIEDARAREGAVLLDYGKDRPSPNPPRLVVVYQTAGKGEDETAVGEALARKLTDLLNGCAQVHADCQGVRPSARGDEVRDLSQLARDGNAQRAVGLSFTERPIVTGQGETTIHLVTQLRVVAAGADRARVTQSVEAGPEKRDAGDRKGLREAQDQLLAQAARELATAVLRAGLRLSDAGSGANG